jgi:hypothetical protein
MPHLRIREIIDELNALGGMTASHHVLITELVATCLLSAAGPKPQPIHPDVEAAEERRARDRERKRVSRESPGKSEESVVYNNINNSLSGKGGVGGKPIPRNRGTRLPDDWNPSENLWSWGKEKLPEADLRFETAAFKDFWAAKPGVAGTKLDWDKTWKTWVREAVRRRERFKPKDNVVSFVSSGPKRSWAEQRAEKASQEGK